MTDSPVDEMMLLCRTASVKVYTNKFFALACHDADLTEQQLVQMYTKGLVNSLKMDITLRRPSSLDHAIMLVRVYEQRQLLALSDPGHGRGTRATTHPSAGLSASKGDSNVAAPASASSASLGLSKTTPLMMTLPRRRLTASEMAQRRADPLLQLRRKNSSWAIAARSYSSLKWPLTIPRSWSTRRSSARRSSASTTRRASPSTPSPTFLLASSKPSRSTSPSGCRGSTRLRLVP